MSKVNPPTKCMTWKYHSWIDAIMKNINEHLNVHDSTENFHAHRNNSQIKIRTDVNWMCESSAIIFHANAWDLLLSNWIWVALMNRKQSISLFWYFYWFYHSIFVHVRYASTSNVKMAIKQNPIEKTNRFDGQTSVKWHFMSTHLFISIIQWANVWREAIEWAHDWTCRVYTFTQRSQL